MGLPVLSDLCTTNPNQIGDTSRQKEGKEEDLKIYGGNKFSIALWEFGSQSVNVNAPTSELTECRRH